MFGDALLAFAGWFGGFVGEGGGLGGGEGCLGNVSEGWRRGGGSGRTMVEAAWGSSLRMLEMSGRLEKVLRQVHNSRG